MEGGTFRTFKMQKAFKRFVMIELHTDAREPPEAREASQKSREYQRERFKTIGIPYYALLDSTGEKIYWQAGGVRSEAEFLEKLKSVP